MRTLLIPLLMVASGAASAQSLNVFYSGRTLGYLRYPDRQDPGMDSCGWKNLPMNEPADRLYKAWSTVRQHAERPLLVGMGDNFAPDLFARTFDGAPPRTHAPVPNPGKDLYIWDDDLHQWQPDSSVIGPLGPHDRIPADNVGCFVLSMGYAALTPGKHDFYFGPERLRLMAKFLYAQPEHGTALLAANLSIASTAPDAKPRWPLYQVEHELRAKMTISPGGRAPYSVLPILSNDDPSPGITLPDVVLPYYRRFEVDNAFLLLDDLNHRVIPADLIEPHKLLMTAGGAPATSAEIVAGTPSSLEGNGVGPMKVKVKLRIDGLKICPNATRDPYAFDIAKCITVPPAATGPDGKAPDGTDFKSGRIAFETSTELLPDQNYAACMHVVEDPASDSHNGQKTALASKSRPAEYYCQAFYVAEPFFSFDRIQNRKPGEGEPRHDDPFIVKCVFSEKDAEEVKKQGCVNQAGAIKVAIFGLLDSDLQAKLGRLNYGWWNTDPKFETTATISGLQDALKQAMMRCRLVNDCATSDRKILLAQMPAAKATQFLDSITDPRFDLVVSETDSNNKTVPSTLDRDLPDNDSSPKFVVVPGEVYSAGKLTLQLQQATVDQTAHSPAMPPSTKVPQTWVLTNGIVAANPKDYPLPNPDSAACNIDSKGAPISTSLRCLAIQTLIHDGLPATATNMNSTWSSGQILQRLALLTMQRQKSHHADISMLQTRDLFHPELYGPAKINDGNLQSTLDQLFWKGDYAVRVPVTGATLTAMMQASSDFSTLESSPTNIDLEKGRSLLTLGIFKEAADQNWTVNGQILDPAKLYEVSMTDYLALGDTGYTQLKTPIVPYPYRIKDFRKIDVISAMICREIRSATMPHAKCYEGPLNSLEHLDYTTSLPPDTTAGMTAWRQTVSYLYPPYRWARFERFYAGQNAGENLSTQKPYWSFELEKGDFGLNVYVHKKFATTDPANPPVQTAALKNQFAGITVAPVTAPNTYAETFDDRWRLKRSYQHFDWFLLHEAAYSYSRTQDTSDNGYTRSLSQNMMAMETGFLGHLWPARRTPRRLDMLLSGRIESQVLSPREDIPLADGTTLPGTLRRPVDVYGKIGPHYSDERSWFEFGYLRGRSLVNPYQIVFNNGRGDAPLLIPGCNQCSAPYPGGLANPPAANAPFLDWVSYLSSSYSLQPTPAGAPAVNCSAGIPGCTTPLIDANTKFYGRYTGRPLSGLFLNFSYNVPLPVFNHYQDWAGGKPIALLAENTGRYFFDNAGDLSTQTKYFDKLALSIVIPVAGNLSFKPEVDLVFYRNKVAELPFHSINYIGTLSYTFSWREGQPWKRVWRYASPTPTASVPASGR